jgi:hypothetical protein
VAHKPRTFLATARITGEEDNGLLNSPLRKPDEIRRHYSVGTCKFENETVINDPVLRYMNETSVVETGTHEKLMKSGRDYARLWRIQAEAFA